jgi:uncharacterized protein (DUF302 family)
MAHQAIDVEPDIGLLLPCNILLREDKEGTVTVGFMDPGVMLDLVENPELSKIANIVREKIQNAAKAIEA